MTEFTGVHTVLGHLVQEAFKSPLSVDSHIQLHFMMPLCLNFWFCEFFLHWRI